MKSIKSRTSSGLNKDARLRLPTGRQAAGRLALCLRGPDFSRDGVFLLPHSLENTKMKFLYFARFVRQ